MGLMKTVGLMKTEELIDTLARDLAGSTTHPAPPLSLRLLGATVLASLPSLFIIVFVLARSPHLAHGLTATIDYTVASALALAMVAFGMTMTLSRPEATAPRAWLLLPAVILAAGIGMELVQAPQDTWATRFWGNSPLACFVCVLLLSLPILVGVLVALRHGAPTRPRTMGAMAGLLAGGVAAALYTLHCPEGSLLFIAAWHVPAILLVSLLGAAIATRLLAW